MAGGENLKKYVQETLPGMVRGMVSKGGNGSYNTEKDNGFWMKNGKMGADAWHTGAIGKAMSGGFINTRGIKNAKDFKMGGMRKMKSATGRYDEATKALKSARQASRKLNR